MRFVLRIVLVALIASIVSVTVRHFLFKERAPAKKSTIVEKAVEKVSSSDKKEEGKEIPLFVSGIAIRQNRINVVLNDGRTLIEGDPSLGIVTRAFAVVDRKRVYLHGVTEGAQNTGPARSESGSLASPQAAAVAAAKPGWSGETRGDWRADPDGVLRLVNPGTLSDISAVGR